MSLFRLDLNGTTYYVEAPTMCDAVIAWKAADFAEWGNEVTDEEPESCVLVYDGPVIRSESPQTDDAVGQRSENPT